MKTNLTLTTSKATARMIALLVFMLLSGVGMFGQNVKTVQTAAVSLENTVAADETVAAATTTASANTSMNMVSWFMGTKQTPNANNTEAATNSKKQLINSGVAPNRLLMKAFLKKASGYNSTIA